VHTPTNSSGSECGSPRRQLFNWSLALAPAIFIALGIALRVRALIFNAPFYVDEAMLARNVEDRPFLQLFHSLDGNQAAPPGFLVLQKFVASLFGRTEFAYRILPFISSLIVLWLTWVLARKILDRVGVMAACAIVSLSWPLVYYAAANKQYEVEALIACVLLLAWMRSEGSPGRLPIAYVGVCIVAPWFSLSAPFVIAAMESGALVQNCGKGFLKFIIGRLPIYFGVIASCGVLYIAVVRETQGNSILQSFWAYAFMPFPPRSLNDIRWFIGNFYGLFRRPIGLPEPGVAPWLFLIGCTVLWRRRIGQFWGIPGVLLWVLIASGLKQYPFAERLLLFAVVPLALTIGLGFSSVVSLFSAGNSWGRVVATVLGGVLLVPVLLTAAARMARPTTLLDFRAAFSYLNEHWQPKDKIVAQSGYDWQIEWYRDRRGGMPLLGSKPIAIASKWRTCEDVRRLLAVRESSGRTWVLLYKSDKSELFYWCAVGLGATHVLSTPDDELFLYPGAGN
jgi:hypothetical protein